MKVKDLMRELTICRKKYGPDFMEWDIFTEQIDEIDKKSKKSSSDWRIVKDITDDWEYFECAGFNTIMPIEKIFTINVNY